MGTAEAGGSGAASGSVDAGRSVGTARGVEAGRSSDDDSVAGRSVDAGRPAAAGRSFDAAADSYERARPGYPAAAIEWLVPEAAGRVLDLAAGTGKLTRLLVRPGRDVVAVEPLPGMRARLADAVPGIEALGGTAEDILLPDADVDSVVVGQAWHWFDQAAAAAEIARVLRPGGTLGILWNFADERIGWVGELWRMIHEAGRPSLVEGQRGENSPPCLGEFFGPAEFGEFSFEQEVDVETVLALVRSRSYIITLPPDRRERLLSDVRHLLRDRTTSFLLPYRTVCWRARRR